MNDEIRSLVAAQHADGCQVFKMPSVLDIPGEAVEFSVDLQNAGVLFLPSRRTLFVGAEAGGYQVFRCDLAEDGVGAYSVDVTVAAIVGHTMKTIRLRVEASGGSIRAAQMLRIGEDEIGADEFGNVMANFYAYLGLLSSGMGSVESANAPKHLNAKRVGKGRPPIVEHKVVTIRPLRSASEAGAGQPGRRLHWRRGHVRRYQSGVITIVRPHLVGTRELGEVIHDAYDCRHMVKAIGPDVTIH